MKFLFSIIFTLSTIISNCQTSTNCDSLVINCCDVSLFNNDTLSVTVHNDAQQEIFSYPGFKLIDASSNVVAMETVNYFGIGSFDQVHYLNISQAFSLPFTGSLELWGGFYDTLYCVFPVTITTNGIQELKNKISVYPNPVIDLVNITGTNTSEIVIYSMQGVLINTFEVDNSTCDLSSLNTGCYFMKIDQEESKPIIIYKK